MIEVKKIADKDVIEQITLSVMQALPEWFSPPEDIAEKAVLHREFPFFAAYNEEQAIGFTALKIHNRFTADIYNMGVTKEFHRCGIGTMLVDECERFCREKGYRCLTVKTLDESAVYAPYDQTRAFYYKRGFIPLEVLKTFWNEENPCLFLAKYLG